MPAVSFLGDVQADLKDDNTGISKNANVFAISDDHISPARVAFLISYMTRVSSHKEPDSVTNLSDAEFWAPHKYEDGTIMKPCFLFAEVLLVCSLLLKVQAGRELQELPTLSVLIQAEPDLSILHTVIESALYDDEFNDPNSSQVTLCSPTNDAFGALDPDRLSQLMETQFVAHIRNLLEFHAIDGRDRAEDVVGILRSSPDMTADIRTRNGEDLTFNLIQNMTVLITTPNTVGSEVTNPNLEAENGIAHKVSGVLLPGFWNTDLVAAVDELGDSYSMFKQLFATSSVQQELVDDPNKVATLLAPTDDAIRNLQAPYNFDDFDGNLQATDDFVNCHLVENIVLPERNLNEVRVVWAADKTAVSIEVNFGEDGERSIVFNDARAVKPDILANNGLIHGIDGALCQPGAGGSKEGEDPGFSKTILYTVLPSVAMICLTVLCVAWMMTARARPRPVYHHQQPYQEKRIRSAKRHGERLAY